MNEFLNAFGVWSTTRAAGLTCYLLLFVSVTAGLMMSLKVAKGRAKALLLSVHESSGWFAFLFGLIHGGVLLFDDYVGFTVRGLLVPFSNPSNPVLTGLGTISFYILFSLILSSDLIKKLGKKTWRMIHFLAFPGFFLALAHGFLMGTDASYLWVKVMYLFTAGIVITLVALRISLSIVQNKRKERVSILPPKV